MRPPQKALIVADGDDALRLYKRVSCAARALGLELHIARKEGGTDKPRVFIDNELLVEGLQRTEAIEQMLTQWLAARRDVLS